GSPCSSTYAFQPSIAARFSIFQRRSFSSLTASAMPASAARDRFRSRVRASWSRSASIDRLAALRVVRASSRMCASERVSCTVYAPVIAHARRVSLRDASAFDGLAQHFEREPFLFHLRMPRAQLVQLRVGFREAVGIAVVEGGSGHAVLERGHFGSYLLD